MTDRTLTCLSCGRPFIWTKKEQEEAMAGKPPDDPAFIYPPTECKSCRPKQDQQRS